jgi:hypothetical protein
MLELSRKIDYRAIAIRELIISGEVAVEDDRRLGERESSFAEVYAAEAEALCAAMLDAGRRQSSWRQGVQAAMTMLLHFAAERPAVANALFREVYVVGGPALAKREEIVERLTAALEVGTEEVDEAAIGIPQPARFVIGAVEGVIAGHLSRGQADRLPGVGPELTRFIIASFHGIEAAKELPVDA